MANELSSMAKQFLAVEDVIREEREQREGVKGKPTPFRVEFRYCGGSRSFRYYLDLVTASEAKARKASYGFMGNARIEYPTSQKIQVQGPRGGWRKYV